MEATGREPPTKLRHEYLRRLGRGRSTISPWPKPLASQRQSETIGAASLSPGVDRVRSDGAALESRLNGTAVGFEAAA